MARPLMKIVGTFCSRSLDTFFDCGGGGDALMWCRDISRHAAGEFSMAVVQANSLLEDASQIESGTHGTFVGVYDGHGGPEAARYVADNLFQWIRSKIF